MDQLFKVEISDQLSGLMIKEILFDNYNFSRRSLSKIKNEGEILLNGQAVYVSVRVKAGDVLQVFIPNETSAEILPQDIPIDIFYEDIDIVVINKQPGLVVHPTRSHYLGTIANGLIYQWLARGENYRFRPVNRLDKDTSGLFIVAKNQYSHHRLALQINENSLKRTYLAVVHGNVNQQEGVINAPILKDPNHATKRLISFNLDEEAKSAITYYQVKEIFSDYSLVELQLGTGRTHQIRVHMSHIAHSLVGDTLYGGKIINDIMERQALHAYKLEFNHPLTGQHLIFESPYPTDMKLLLNYCDKKSQ